MAIVNVEQAKYWNETAGPKWVAMQDVLDGMIAPLGRAVMDRLALAPGGRVLDVGCGCGDSTLDLARRVGPTGFALGADISAPMLARARERATGLAHVRFEHADVESHGFTPDGFDAVFSRFGVMFFADPTAAFRNLHAACRAGGRLAFVCWQGFMENPWMVVPTMAAAQHVTFPPPPAPDAPGPFSFADADRVRRILGDGGFRDVAVEPLPGMLLLAGSTLDDVVDFILQIGPTAAVLRENPDAPIAAIRASIAAALEPYRGEGGVRMPYAAWVVTARA